MAGPAETRQRLMLAAGEVFAESGFHAASVREICRRAEANIAAVSYHFGGKDGLYSATIVETHRAAIDHDTMPRSEDYEDPREALGVFVRWFVTHLLEDGRHPEWLGRLITRELSDPTAALDDLVAGSMRPVFENLRAIVGRVLGADADASLIHVGVTSVLGGCVIHRACEAGLARLHGPRDGSPEVVTVMAERIARYAVAGLDALAAPRETGARS